MAGSEILVECVGKEGYSCKKSKANACMRLYTLLTTYIPICIQVLIYRNMYINVPLCFHSSYSTHTYMSSILSENYFYHTFRIEVAQTNSYRLEQEYIYKQFFAWSTTICLSFSSYCIFTCSLLKFVVLSHTILFVLLFV